MAIKKIPCGGFMYDDETIAFEKDEYGRDVIKIEAGDTLPEVTAADNGKLLGVVEGEWGKVDGGSGDEVVTVTVDYDSGTATMDKTFEEILSLDNPRFVSNYGTPYSLAYIADDGLQLYSISFNNVGRPEETTMYVEVIEATSSSVSFNSGEYKLTEN